MKCPHCKKEIPERRYTFELFLVYIFGGSILGVMVGGNHLGAMIGGVIGVIIFLHYRKKEKKQIGEKT